MPKGVTKDGNKRKRNVVDKTLYSEYYNIKTGLNKLLNKQPFLIKVLRERIKLMTKAAGHFGRFLNYHVLRVFEENESNVTKLGANNIFLPLFLLKVEKLDQSFLQKICGMLFSIENKERSNNILLLKEWSKSLNNVPMLRMVMPGYSESLHYLAKDYSTSIKNSLVLNLDQIRNINPRNTFLASNYPFRVG